MALEQNHPADRVRFEVGDARQLQFVDGRFDRTTSHHLLMDHRRPRKEYCGHNDSMPSLSTRPVGEREVTHVAPGAIWLRNWLSFELQVQLAKQCRALLDGPAGGYTPTVRGGGKMRVQMMCLGRHWNPLTYTYEPTRADHDGLPVRSVPDDWVALASAAACEAGFACTPDICLINFYRTDGRMGLHQDKDESDASLDAGLPVVSLSIGDTARFLFGGLRRREPVETIMLESGDVFVFGGRARLRYHGVARIIPGTAPTALGLDGRLNLTFRQY
jgi:DNA alkylation damage repair protein AlkB